MKEKNKFLFKGVIIGLLITIIGSSLVSMMCLSIGHSLGWIDSYNSLYSIGKSINFMILDIITSCVITIYAGYVSAKIAKHNEMQSGYFIAGISLIIFFLFGSFDGLPILYNVFGLLGIGVCPIIGAYLRVNKALNN